METIICAAVRYGGRVWRGHRHGHALTAMQDELSYTMNRREMHEQQTNRDQGFVTSQNRFVDRKEAYEIALAADQLIGPPLGEQGFLYSEDIY